MKTARLLTLFLLAAIILTIAILLRQQKQSSLSTAKEQAGQKLFSDIAFNDITKFQLIKTNETITLSKVDSTWRVEEKSNYPANFSLIREFLIKIWETKAVQSVPVQANQWGQLDLISPQDQGNAALVKLFKSSNQLETFFYIGKKSEGSPGRYVRLPKKNESIFLVNESFAALNYKLEDWLDKQLIRPQKIASVTVKPVGKPEWKLVRTSETNAFERVGVKKTDNTKADNLVQSLNSLRFDDILETNAVTISSVFKTPSRIEIKTFEGNFYQLAIARETNQNYYTKIETDKKEEKRFENYIYLIPKSLLEPILTGQPLK